MEFARLLGLGPVLAPHVNVRQQPKRAIDLEMCFSGRCDGT